MSEVKAVTVDAYGEPSTYKLTNITKPALADPTDVLIKVHGASINPIDVKKASGIMKALKKDSFPYIIGYDLSGVIEEVGAEVKNLKVGDEVYCRLPEMDRGSWAEYAKTMEKFVAVKPKNIALADAAAIPLAAMTALQSLKKYRGSLEGKTVFIPGGLSGTGAAACQLAKNVFKAGKVITTVSTAKVAKVPELLGEGVVDEIIDYTKQDPKVAIPAKSIDFYFDSMGNAFEHLALMNKDSSIISVNSMPSGTTMQAAFARQTRDGEAIPKVPFPIKLMLDGGDALKRFRAKRAGAEYMFVFLAENAVDLEELRGYYEEGKLKLIIGERVDFHDIEQVKKASEQTFNGKGGVGKTIFEVIKGDAAAVSVTAPVDAPALAAAPVAEDAATTAAAAPAKEQAVAAAPVA
ncbi:hypothetical protein VHEMI08870 [[Torrubiella] hemipterigena]|uniref:Enoyl reductase (ER) domain-containing protein n=1 Tax=[Torrubiella] hemipterigena TaxID=1531966 RepID=A0A0A1TP07_9HYPO|nr:hypothetical protein VHEMI08870 [[Torrubiella] hemipterigena]